MKTSPVRLAVYVTLGALMILGPLSLLARDPSASIRDLSVEELSAQWTEADRTCRSPTETGNNQKPETSCVTRSRLEAELQSRGQCYGEGSRAEADKAWRPCLTPAALAEINAKLAEDARWDRLEAREREIQEARRQWVAAGRNITTDFRVPIGADLGLFQKAFPEAECWEVDALYQCDVTSLRGGGCPAPVNCLSVTFTFEGNQLTSLSANVNGDSWSALLAKTRAAHGPPITSQSQIGPMRITTGAWRTDQGALEFVLFDGTSIGGEPVQHPFHIRYGPIEP